MATCIENIQLFRSNTIPFENLPQEFFSAGIEYAELVGSPQEAYEGQQGRVTRQFLVDWDKRWGLCQGLLGWSKVFKTAGGVTYIQRIPPLPYKENSQAFEQAIDDTTQEIQNFWLYPTQIVSIEGLGLVGKNATATDGTPPYSSYTHIAVPPNTEACNYRKAKVTVSYESQHHKYRTDTQMKQLDADHPLAKDRIFTMDGGAGLDGWVPDEGSLARYVSRHIQPQAEFLTLPFAALFWADDNAAIRAAPVTANQGRIIGSCEVTYTWFQVPAQKPVDPLLINGPPATILTKAARDAIGSVNDAQFDFAAAGTLLLTGVEVRPYRLLGGTFVGDIAYKMKYFSAVDPTEGKTYDQFVDPITNPVPAGEDKPRARGHNYFLRYLPNRAEPDSSLAYTYNLITDNGHTKAGKPPGRTVYRETNFRTLFRPDQL